MIDVKNIAIITPEYGKFSETFIQKHIDYLAGNKKVLFGDDFPCFSVEHGNFFASYYSGWRKIYWKYLLVRGKKGYRQLQEEAFLNFIRKKKINVVFAEYGVTGAKIYHLCKRENIPLIIHFHGFDAYRFSVLKAYNEYYREMFEYATYIFAVSSDMVHQLIRLGAPEEKVILNTYGINIASWECAKPGTSLPHLTAVGRFVEKKAPILTLLAFQKVLKKVPEAKLYWVGSGELEGITKITAKALKIEPNVHFLGVKNSNEIKEMLYKSRAFVQHSVVAPSGDSEGTPNSILEACAAGLPVIATRHKGINDVLQDGETGFLVDEGDIDEMAKNMLKLLNDPELAAKMGKKARHMIASHFIQDDHIGAINKAIHASFDRITKDG